MENLFPKPDSNVPESELQRYSLDMHLADTDELLLDSVAKVSVSTRHFKKFLGNIEIQ